MKLLYLPLVIVLYLIPSVSLADPMDKIAELVRRGNTHELAALFAPTVEVAVFNEENIYSKAQAELVLDKFFTQNKVREVKTLHKINSNASYRFGVLILTTDKGIFRLAFTLKGPDSDFTLIDIHIETDKVK